MTQESIEVDRYVGAQIHARRQQLGVSQEQLGAEIGVAPHQLQEFEKGESRVGAARLTRISRVLEVPASYFFADVDDDGGALVRGLGVPGSVDLLASYAAITDPEDRKALVDLLKAVAAKSRPAGAG